MVTVITKKCYHVNNITKYCYHKKMITFDNIDDNFDDNFTDININKNIFTNFNLTDNKSITCDHCFLQFGYRSGKSRHMKTCELNPKRKQVPFRLNGGLEAHEPPLKKAKDINIVWNNSQQPVESCIIYSDNQQQQPEQQSTDM